MCRTSGNKQVTTQQRVQTNKIYQDSKKFGVQPSFCKRPTPTINKHNKYYDITLSQAIKIEYFCVAAAHADAISCVHAIVIVALAICNTNPNWVTVGQMTKLKQQLHGQQQQGMHMSVYAVNAR